MAEFGLGLGFNVHRHLLVVNTYMVMATQFLRHQWQPAVLVGGLLQLQHTSNLLTQGDKTVRPCCIQHIGCVRNQNFGWTFTFQPRIRLGKPCSQRPV